MYCEHWLHGSADIAAVFSLVGFCVGFLIGEGRRHVDK